MKASVILIIFLAVSTKQCPGQKHFEQMALDKFLTDSLSKNIPLKFKSSKFTEFTDSEAFAGVTICLNDTTLIENINPLLRTKNDRKRLSIQKKYLSKGSKVPSLKVFLAVHNNGRILVKIQLWYSKSIVHEYYYLFDESGEFIQSCLQKIII